MRRLFSKESPCRRPSWSNYTEKAGAMLTARLATSLARQLPRAAPKVFLCSFTADVDVLIYALFERNVPNQNDSKFSGQVDRLQVPLQDTLVKNT